MTTWTLTTPDDGSITLDGMRGEMYTPRPGDTVNAEFTMSKQHFDIVEKYILAANDQVVLTGRSSQGTTYYRTKMQEYSVNDLLIGLSPDTMDTGGIWAVITGGSDTSNVPRSEYRWDIEMFVVSDYSEFSTLSDVQSARGSSIL